MIWHIWLIIAIVCFIIETFTVEFTFLMLGGAALVTTGVAFGTDSLAWQIIAFGVAALVLDSLCSPLGEEQDESQGTGCRKRLRSGWQDGQVPHLD